MNCNTVKSKMSAHFLKSQYSAVVFVFSEYARLVRTLANTLCAYFNNRIALIRIFFFINPLEVYGLASNLLLEQTQFFILTQH